MKTAEPRNAHHHHQFDTDFCPGRNFGNEKREQSKVSSSTAKARRTKTRDQITETTVYISAQLELEVNVLRSPSWRIRLVLQTELVPLRKLWKRNEEIGEGMRGRGRRTSMIDARPTSSVSRITIAAAAPSGVEFFLRNFEVPFRENPLNSGKVSERDAVFPLFTFCYLNLEEEGGGRTTVKERTRRKRHL
ncbi:hypothetical protein ACJRO7_006052 [Eucalyptus globulus]|uniref:Uncharacterized protein n=1 Tax=Eucalyptus globulus TaxID=34317 RepID=A0ABD3IJ85_EUCGL